MVNDRLRTYAFAEALRRAMRPGSVVLDVGAGTGVFALLACQFGASRVYAAETSDAIEVGRECARASGTGDRIVWLQEQSTEIELPERVDVVIGDLHGTLPMYGAGIVSLIDARRRHLKPGGCMIPGRDLVRVVPAEAPGEFESVTLPWEQNDHALDLRAARRFAANSWWRAAPEPVPPERLLSSPSTWGEIDYSRVESPSLDRTLTWEVDRAGTFHGFYVWFDGEVAPGLGYSNAPEYQELVYGRAFFPLLEALEVGGGDRVTARFIATMIAGEYVFTWNTAVADRSGASKTAFRQSTFNGTPMSAQSLRTVSSDYVPRLNRKGEIDAVVLACITQGQTLGEIAALLLIKFPDSFPSLAAALARVATLSSKYASVQPTTHS